MRQVDGYRVLLKGTTPAHAMPFNEFSRMFTSNNDRLHSVRTARGEVQHHGNATNPKNRYPIHGYAHQDMIDRWKKEKPDIKPDEVRARMHGLELGYSVRGQHPKAFISGHTIDEVVEAHGQKKRGYGSPTGRRTINIPSPAHAHEAAVLQAHREGQHVPEHNRKAYPKVFDGTYVVKRKPPGQPQRPQSFAHGEVRDALRQQMFGDRPHLYQGYRVVHLA